MIKECFSINHVQFMEIASLHLIQPIELHLGCHDDGAIGIFFQSPYMISILGDQGNRKIQVSKTKHDSDLRSVFAQDALDTWLHGELAIDQRAKKLEVFTTFLGRINDIKMIFDSIKSHLILATPIMNSILNFVQIFEQDFRHYHIGKFES